VTDECIVAFLLDLGGELHLCVLCSFDVEAFFNAWGFSFKVLRFGVAWSLWVVIQRRRCLLVLFLLFLGEEVLEEFGITA